MMRNPSIGKCTIWLITALLGIAATTADAQDKGSRQTREFVQATASSDTFEVAAAQAALTQSSNPDVHAFASRMIQDHQQMAKALMDAAARSGLKPPALAMSPDQAQLLGALQCAGKTDFDALYLKQQALAHRSALTVQQMYATSGDDPNVRQSASSAVPVVSSHADMAEQMAAKLGKQ